MIAGDGRIIEERHRVLGKRRGADQPQPWVEPAAAQHDIDQNGDAGGVERNGGVGFRRVAQPIRDLGERAYRSRR